IFFQEARVHTAYDDVLEPFRRDILPQLQHELPLQQPPVQTRKVEEAAIYPLHRACDSDQAQLQMPQQNEDNPILNRIPVEQNQAKDREEAPQNLKSQEGEEIPGVKKDGAQQ